ncbi:MAG: hypothetical protein ACOCTK_02075 [Candidatus Saliniplasma sp.]
MDNITTWNVMKRMFGMFADWIFDSIGQRGYELERTGSYLLGYSIGLFLTLAALDQLGISLGFMHDILILSAAILLILGLVVFDSLLSGIKMKRELKKNKRVIFRDSLMGVSLATVMVHNERPINFSLKKNDIGYELKVLEERE